MLKNLLRKGFIILLCQTLAYSPLLRADQLSLPSGDLIAPQITQDKYIDKVDPGADHDISVTVTDENGVKQVTLYYRQIGTEEYQRLTMNNIANSDDYHAIITADLIKGPGVEYYIQAMDKAGNSVLHGYSFSPLSVKTDSNAAILAASSNNATIENEESSNMWLWIGLGALAVVVAVAAGGGGGGGGSEPASTGTVVISGPTP